MHHIAYQTVIQDSYLSYFTSFWLCWLRVGWQEQYDSYEWPAGFAEQGRENYPEKAIYSSATNALVTLRWLNLART